MKTIENLKTENWYYSQMFPRPYDEQITCIVFAKDTKEAEELSKQYAHKAGKDNVEVHLYHKNYKLQAKKMVEQGKFIWD